jgi:hypothetical protein
MAIGIGCRKARDQELDALRGAGLVTLAFKACKILEPGARLPRPGGHVRAHLSAGHPGPQVDWELQDGRRRPACSPCQKLEVCASPFMRGLRAFGLIEFLKTN